MTEGAHLSDSVLAGFLDNRLDAATRRQAVVHLDGCADCRAELVAVAGLADPYRASPAARRRRFWLVAGTALAAGITGIILSRGPGLPDETRETVRTPVVGSTEAPRIIAVTPRDGAAVTPAGAQFTWRAYTADTYRFVLLEEDGTPAWSSDTHDTSLVLPAEIILAAGRTYFWRVDALADGIAASTGTLRVQVPR